MFWKNKKDPSLNKDAILATLKEIKLADGSKDLVSAQMVSEIFIKDGSVIFSLNVEADKAEAMEPVRQQAERAVLAMPGVEKAMVALTAERKPGSATAAQPPKPAPKPAQQPKQRPQGGGARIHVEGVRHIVAVSSAKGGVGKSTSAVNLALGLKANGLKVGILDADIYGPSIPRLLGITDKPEMIEGTRTLKPMQAYGIVAMSIGFLVEEDTPMIWRGPMVVSALTQMLRDVAWNINGELDVLVVDMPPGTGDIQLTMAQQVPLSGSVIISTPQDLALLDARKGIAMFEKVQIPILGLIENMSYFQCPNCGERHEIFGHGGARETAADINVPFLGEVPLHIDIRERADSGKPIVAIEPDSDHTAIYLNLAQSIANMLQKAGKSAPKIVFE